MNRVRRSVRAASLVIMLLISGSVSTSASLAANSVVQGKGPVLLCASNTRVSARAMRDDLRVVRSRLGEAYGTQSRRVVRLGSHCIRVAIPRVQAAILRQVIQPGDVVMTAGGSRPLNPGAEVRTKCRLGVCPPGFTRGTTLRPGQVHPLLRVVVAGSMVVRGSAVLGRNQANVWTVVYTLTRRGSRLWCSYTGSHVNQYAAIVLDGAVLEDPVVQSAICGGQSQIVLGSHATARRLVMYLNSGPLLVPLHVVA